MTHRRWIGIGCQSDVRYCTKCCLTRPIDLPKSLACNCQQAKMQAGEVYSYGNNQHQFEDMVITDLLVSSFS